MERKTHCGAKSRWFETTHLVFFPPSRDCSTLPQLAFPLPAYPAIVSSWSLPSRGALFQESLYLNKDLRNGRGLWKHGLDVLRVAVDVFVSVYIRLSVGVASRMTGGLVEPNLEELGVLELERLGLVSKTQGDPVGDNDQLSTSFESDSSRKRVAPFELDGPGATTGYRHRVLREAIDGFPTQDVRIVYDRDQGPGRITFLDGDVQAARSHLPLFDRQGGQTI